MKNINYQKIILSTIAITGLVGMAVLAPNALQSLKMFLPKKKGWSKEKYYMNNSVKTLLKKGLIKKVKKGSVEFIELTKKGREMISQYELEEIETEKPKNWDKKWRVIIFLLKTNFFADEDVLYMEVNRIENEEWLKEVFGLTK